jgi:2-polyprenyl-6-methoxyphenol hydroxylase-like FAD-dependent oxidoreductase
MTQVGIEADVRDQLCKRNEFERRTLVGNAATPVAVPIAAASLSQGLEDLFES